VLPLDLQPYDAKLKNSSPQGAKPINRETILRALLVAPLEGISTFTKLQKNLESDLRFRYQCRFRLDELAPSIATLNRVFNAVVDKDLAKELFVDLSVNADTARELPVALEVTPAHVYDSEMAIPLMKDVVENYNWNVRYVMMDAGYDR
jgi:Transposase domain (DUF772)